MGTRTTPWPAGTPCWVDYAAADASGARDFYGKVLGWSFTDANEEFGGYVTALKDDRGAAGLMPKMDQSQPSAWLTYFATEDSAATAESITAAGGTIIAGPHPVGALGHMIVALDDQGAAFGTWEAGEHTGVQIFNEPGGLIWNEAAAPDTAAAKSFYSAVFGFSFEAYDGAPDYSTFSTGEGMLGGLSAHQPGAPVGWQTCFSVASADDAVATVAAEGGKVLSPPADQPFGRFAVVEDPWGASFSVMSELP